MSLCGGQVFSCRAGAWACSSSWTRSLKTLPIVSDRLSAARVTQIAHLFEVIPSIPLIAGLGKPSENIDLVSQAIVSQTTLVDQSPDGRRFVREALLFLRPSASGAAGAAEADDAPDAAELMAEEQAQQRAQRVRQAHQEQRVPQEQLAQQRGRRSWRSSHWRTVGRHEATRFALLSIFHLTRYLARECARR